MTTLTKEPASAIDSYEDLKKKGVDLNPLERYLRAESLMSEDREKT